MKKIIVMIAVLSLVLALAAPVMAHPRGPSSMPDESVGGLHRAVFEVPDFPYHIIRGLMLRTDVDAPHAPCE